MATPTPAQVDRLLSSIEYPVSKAQLTQRASEKRTAQSLRSLLEQLPAKRYESPANVRQQLEKLEPGLTAVTADGTANQIQEQEETTSGGMTLPAPVRDALHTAKVQGTRIAGEAGTQLVARVDERRADAARLLVATATTAREASASLEQRGQAQLGQAASVAAEKLEAVSQFVQETEARQMARGAQELARRYPMAVVAAGVAVGALAVRVVRSANAVPSSPSAEQQQSGEAPPSADAIGLLEGDHREIRRLLRRGESAAVDRRQGQLSEIKELLQNHERMEEEVFYPALQSNAATRELVLESFAEHHVVDEIMAEIEQTPVTDEMWKARFTAMQENLEQHIAEEEEQLLPLARQALTKGELAELGQRMKDIKELATAANSA